MQHIIFMERNRANPFLSVVSVVVFCLLIVFQYCYRWTHAVGSGLKPGTIMSEFFSPCLIYTIDLSSVAFYSRTIKNKGTVFAQELTLEGFVFLFFLSTPQSIFFTFHRKILVQVVLFQLSPTQDVLLVLSQVWTIQHLSAGSDSAPLCSFSLHCFVFFIDENTENDNSKLLPFLQTSRALPFQITGLNPAFV